MQKFKLAKKPIVNAIRALEKKTSAELRVAVKKRYMGDSIELARDLFTRMKMNETEERNGVLIVVEPQKRKVTVFGDEGIYRKAGHCAFEDAVRLIEREFKKANYSAGVVSGIERMAEILSKHFPPKRKSAKNELADSIASG